MHKKNVSGLRKVDESKWWMGDDLQQILALSHHHHLLISSEQELEYSAAAE
jgi:hypothetical protein